MAKASTAASQGWGSPETLQMVFHCSAILYDFSLTPDASLKSDMQKLIIHHHNDIKLHKLRKYLDKTITRKMDEQKCAFMQDQKEIKDGYQSLYIRNTDQLCFITSHKDQLLETKNKINVFLGKVMIKDLNTNNQIIDHIVALFSSWSYILTTGKSFNIVSRK